jgi:DNA modification methylase
VIHHADDWLTIHGGDCREVLRDLPAESVHCVVTSPPYWGLRDYGTATWEGGDPDCDHVMSRALKRDTNGGMLPAGEGTRGTQSSTASSVLLFRDACGKCGARRIDAQLGLEPTPEAYVAAMVDVFREVRRVLRDDGTVWLNLGDSYAGNGGGVTTGKGALSPDSEPYKKWLREWGGLKPKDLVGIPWRVAFALQADGWYLRSDVVWSKPNPMPESVTDRPTKSHEYVFLLAKSPRYFFDADAVREKYSDKTWFYDHVEPTKAAGKLGNNNGTGRSTLGVPDYQTHSGRNIRSVWTIATAPYPGAHFATFPPKLVEPCVKAGTSERGVCPECSAPWERVVERTVAFTSGSGRSGNPPNGKNGTEYEQATSGSYDVRMGPSVHSQTTGWRPTCAHEADPVPAVVLDPFAGTGTVGMVAQSLSRRAVLVDLNPEYLRQCLTRNAQAPLGLGA